MIPKSGHRFSDKIMREQSNRNAAAAESTAGENSEKECR